MGWDILVIILGFVLLIIGIVSCVLPPLPGAPIVLAAVGLLDWHSPSIVLSPWFYVVYGVLAVGSTFFDNVLAVYGTKKMGGTKAGIRGSFIGLIAGLFFLGPFLGPLAIIVGPFIGAVVGELIVGTNPTSALRSGVGSFVGFLLGTGLKLAIALVLSYYFFRSVFTILS